MRSASVLILLRPALISLGLALGSCASGVDQRPPLAALEVLGSGMGFLEGPVWVESQGHLIFSDIPRGKLMRWTKEDGVTEFMGAPAPNGNALDPNGRLVTCQQGDRRLTRRAADSGELIEVVTKETEAGRYNSPNDLAIERDGTIWFTDPPWGLPKQTEGRELDGHLVFRWDPDSGTSVAMFDRFCMPNGIALSLDERTLYVSDTGGHPSHPDPARHDVPATVTAFAIDVDPPVVRWTIPKRSDGMCVDQQGRIYLTGPPGVTVHDSNGRQVDEMAVPGSTTNVTLGGVDGLTLFITAGDSLYRTRIE